MKLGFSLKPHAIRACFIIQLVYLAQHSLLLVGCSSPGTWAFSQVYYLNSFEVEMLGTENGRNVFSHESMCSARESVHTHTHTNEPGRAFTYSPVLTHFPALMWGQKVRQEHSAGVLCKVPLPDLWQRNPDPGMEQEG